MTLYFLGSWSQNRGFAPITPGLKTEFKRFVNVAGKKRKTNFYIQSLPCWTVVEELVLVVPISAQLILALLLWIVLIASLVFFFSRWYGKRIGFAEKRATNLAWTSTLAYVLVGLGGPVIILLMAWFIKRG
jgi:hypothetical protein